MCLVCWHDSVLDVLVAFVCDGLEYVLGSGFDFHHRLLAVVLVMKHRGWVPATKERHDFAENVEIL